MIFEAVLQMRRSIFLCDIGIAGKTDTGINMKLP